MLPSKGQIRVLVIRVLVVSCDPGLNIPKFGTCTQRCIFTASLKKRSNIASAVWWLARLEPLAPLRMAFDFKFPVVLFIQSHSLWAWALKALSTWNGQMQGHFSNHCPKGHIHDPCCPQNEDLTSYRISTSWSALTVPASLPLHPPYTQCFCHKTHLRRSKHILRLCWSSRISPSKFPFRLLSLEKSSLSLQGTVKWCCLHHILPHFPLITALPLLSIYPVCLSCISAIHIISHWII